MIETKMMNIMKAADAAVTASEDALAAARLEVVRLEGVVREVRSTRRGVYTAADANLPRLQVVTGYRGIHLYYAAVIRRTDSSVWVRAQGEPYEVRFIRPRGGGDWWRQQGECDRWDGPRIRATDIAALVGVSDG